MIEGDGTAVLPHPGYRPKLQFDPLVDEYLRKAFGADHFTTMCHALTCPSNYSCIRVNTLQTTRREVIRKLVETVDAMNTSYQKMYGERKDVSCSIQMSEQSQNTEPTMMVPCWDIAGGLSSQIDKTLECGPCYEHPLLKNVVIVQGHGPCQVDYSRDCGQMKEVIVSRKCAEAVLRGANVFVPGVLACSGHVEQGDIVAVSVAVEHLDGNGNWVVGVTRGTILFSEHGKSQLNDEERRNWYIGKGKAMLSRTGIFRELQGVAVEMTDRVYRLPPLHGVLKGEIFLQNLPSIIATMALDPKPGERILDMCAAPGGKSTAIAILMKDEGEVVAIDRSHNKVMDIIKLAEEMKLTCIHAYKLDAMKAVQREDENESYENGQGGENARPVSELTSMPSVSAPIIGEIGKSDNEGCMLASSSSEEVGFADVSGKKKGRPQYRSNAQARKEARKMRNGPGRNQTSGRQANRAKGFLPHSFDRVLLDPPCSALGLRPRLFAGEETVEGLRRHGTYQRRMLDQAVQLCRPGGIIVYSTCTVNPGENEAVVRYALDTYSFLSLELQDPKLGGPGLTGGQNVSGGLFYEEWLRDDEQYLVQRFDPSGPLDTIGFFIAKFKVKSHD